MRRTLSAALVVAIPMLGTAGAATLIERLVVFGDSLSDVGNVEVLSAGLLPPDPYFDGRYSNGPLWIDGLAEGLGLASARVPVLEGGTNFAFAGATVVPGGADTPPVPTLQAQAEAYRLSRLFTGIDPNTLIAVWGGANDVRSALATHRTDPAAAEARVRAAADGVGGIVRDLIDAGGDRFLLVNQPDIGALPAVRAQGEQAVEEARSLTGLFNEAFAQQLATLDEDTAAELITLDAFELFEQLSDPGTVPSFDNTTDPCVAGSTMCADPDEHLFWDEAHPTARAHAVGAEEALDALRSANPHPVALASPAGAVPSAVTSAVAEPATLALLSAGLFGTGLARLRRRPRPAASGSPRS